MFREPVARKITSPSATSEAASFQAILIDSLSSQKTMRVKKCNGSAEEPVDVTKIVRANELYRAAPVMTWAAPIVLG